MSLVPPFRLARPADWRVPIVVSAPHAGTCVPPGFVLPAGAAGQRVVAMSDTAIDALARPAAQTHGFPVLSSLYLRAFIDLNRSEEELDPELIEGAASKPELWRPGSRLAAGLGLVPRLADPTTPIYDRKLTLAEVQARVRQVYAPYHAALRGLIQEATTRFGTCLLIDLHSMPPLAPAVARRCLALTPGQPTKRQHKFPTSRAPLVLGDGFGASLSPALSHAAVAFWQGQGVPVSRNRPYAGGHIAQTYGRWVPTLQMEFCRTLVPGTHKTPATHQISTLMVEFIALMVDQILVSPLEIAAE